MIFDIIFHLSIYKNYNHLTFLNKKRFSEKLNLGNNNQKLEHFIKNEKNKKIFYVSKKLKINNNFINNIENKKNCISKINDTKQFYNNKCYHNQYSINNLFEIENCNSIFINKTISKKKHLNNRNIINDINDENNKKIKEKIFSIQKKNKITSKKMGNSSNEIRVKKNNKFIFMNKLLIKKKSKKKDIIKKKCRKSLYRGVSKNGNKWQTIISYKYFKGYIGSYPTQDLAARVYDIFSIKYRGIKAKTNFKYNLHQIQKIIEVNIDYKSDNIEEIILNLIN